MVHHGGLLEQKRSNAFQRGSSHLRGSRNDTIPWHNLSILKWKETTNKNEKHNTTKKQT